MTYKSAGGTSRGQEPDPLLRENRWHLPDYAYIETSEGLLLGALGTRVADGRYEAFPLHVRTSPPPVDALEGRGYRKVWKTDLVSLSNPGHAPVPDTPPDPLSGALLASPVAVGPHGVLLSGDSVTRVWLPTFSVEEAAQVDEEVWRHRTMLARVEEAVGATAFVVGSRSFGLGLGSSDIDVLFAGESTYRRFCARKQAILETAGLEFRSQSDLTDVAGRYERYYRIPKWVAESIWTRRFTKVRSRWLRMSFHFTHSYQIDVWPEFEESRFGATAVCEGIVTECDHSAFMPRRYRVAVGSTELIVLTKMFLYAGVADVGDLVQIQGTRVGSGAMVLTRYGDYIVRLGP